MVKIKEYYILVIYTHEERYIIYIGVSRAQRLFAYEKSAIRFEKPPS